MLAASERMSCRIVSRHSDGCGTYQQEHPL